MFIKYRASVSIFNTVIFYLKTSCNNKSESGACNKTFAVYVLIILNIQHRGRKT